MARKDYIQKSFTFNGKRRYVYGKNESDVAVKMALLKEKLERDEVVIQSSMKVSDWIRICIDTYKTNLKPSTLATYEARMRVCVTEPLGNFKLKSVRPINCQNAINRQAGKSKWYIDQTYQMMNFIFEKAVENKLIASNPAKNIVRPTGTKTTHRALTKAEQEVFLKAAKDHVHGLLFLLMYGCGCRPSEAAAIEGRDLTVKDGRLYLHIRGTKSKAADRYVPVPPEVRSLLPDHPEPFALLCTTSKGNKICERQIRRAWHSMEREMNILMGCRLYRNQLVPPYPLASDLTPYCLRHTYCTNLRDMGIDIRTAQYLMGHSDIKMTANIYTHTTLDDLASDWDKINAGVL